MMKFDLWIIWGLVGYSAFGARFLLQWIMSERIGRSVLPVAFWYLSLLGSFMVLTYAIIRLEPVFIIGQSCGALIYSRNLYLTIRERGFSLRGHIG